MAKTAIDTTSCFKQSAVMPCNNFGRLIPVLRNSAICFLVIAISGCESGNHIDYATTDCANVIYDNETKTVYEVRVAVSRIEDPKALWIKLGKEPAIPLVDLKEEAALQFLDLPESLIQDQDDGTRLIGISWTHFCFERGKLVSATLRGSDISIGRSPKKLKPLEMSLDDVPSVFGEIRSYEKQKVMAP